MTPSLSLKLQRKLHRAVLILLPLCLLEVAVAGNLFIAPDTYLVGKGPGGIALGDFNKDGKQDLVTANRIDASVSVLLGFGTGKFKKAVTYKTGSNPWAVVVADFNQDGKVDLATVNSGGSSVSVLFGNGDGSFGRPINTTVPRSPRSIAVGDFNGDGLPDLV